MKLFSFVLISLFALVGAHVPKAFSLFYLAMLMSWLMSRHLDQRPLPPLPIDRSRLLRTVQVLVLLFSCTYPLAMLHFGFWQLSGRQLLDVVSALVLPSALLWWGAYWVRRDLHLSVACMVSYGMGGLLFLLAALMKTWGLSWFAHHDNPATLLMAWGSEVSMNVRSIEQNGILCMVLAPVALVLLMQKRYRTGCLMLLVVSIGLLAVLPLKHGRLWMVSMALAWLPFVCSASRLLWRNLKAAVWTRWFRVLAIAAPVTMILSLILSTKEKFCEERFGLYGQAMRQWNDLIVGGRVLTFETLRCDGRQVSVALLTHGSRPSTITMLHNVPLDIVASVGFLPALPLLIALLVSCFFFARFAIFWLEPVSWNQHSIHLFLIWTFLTVLVPQWLFQPLMYGDGLLYYFSYALLGALLVVVDSTPSSQKYLF